MEGRMIVVGMRPRVVAAVVAGGGGLGVTAGGEGDGAGSSPPSPSPSPSPPASGSAPVSSGVLLSRKSRKRRKTLESTLPTLKSGSSASCSLCMDTELALLAGFPGACPLVAMPILFAALGSRLAESHVLQPEQSTLTCQWLEFLEALRTL